MPSKRWLSCIILCLLVGAMILVCVDHAYAQKSTTNLDKGLSQKHGVGESLASASDKKGKKPSKLQMFVGIGSIGVMIAVVKWL